MQKVLEPLLIFLLIAYPFIFRPIVLAWASAHQAGLHALGEYILALCAVLVLGFLAFAIMATTVNVARSLLLRSGTVSTKPLRRLLFAYVGLIIVMAAVYAWVQYDSDGMAFAGMAFNQQSLFSPAKIRPNLVDALYFSEMTAAPVGYGEIVPKSTLAKGLVMLHVLMSQFITVVLLGAVLSKLSASP